MFLKEPASPWLVHGSRLVAEDGALSSNPGVRHSHGRDLEVCPLWGFPLPDFLTGDYLKPAGMVNVAMNRLLN